MDFPAGRRRTIVVSSAVHEGLASVTAGFTSTFFESRIVATTVPVSPNAERVIVSTLVDHLPTCCLTVTAIVVVAASELTVTVVEPLATAINWPAVLTVAMAGLALTQVKPGLTMLSAAVVVAP